MIHRSKTTFPNIFLLSVSQIDYESEMSMDVCVRVCVCLCRREGMWITLNIVSEVKIKQGFIAALTSSDVYSSLLNRCVYIQEVTAGSVTHSVGILTSVFSTVGTPHTLGKWHLLVVHMGAYHNFQIWQLVCGSHITASCVGTINVVWKKDFKKLKKNKNKTKQT